MILGRPTTIITVAATSATRRSDSDMNLALPAKTRKAVYAFAGAVAVALAFAGVVRADAIPVILGVVYTATNLLALVNVTPDDDPVDEEIDGPGLPTVEE